MALLLTMLSVLALWAFLTVLVLGLLVILKALEGVRRNLEQIAMGVRAIEHQARPLGAHAGTLAVRLEATTHAVDALAASLERTARQLSGPAPDGRP